LSRPDVNDSDFTRFSPFSEEAEQSVLGSMLLSERAVSRAVDAIDSPEYFHRKSHRLIFDTIQDMFQDEVEIDGVTVASELESRDKLADAGGSSYINELLNATPTPAHVEDYAEIVREKYVLRQLIETCTDIIEMSYEETEDVEELLDRAEQEIFSVRKDQIHGGLEKINHAIDSMVEELNETHQGDEDVTGLQTGYAQFDNMTTGFQENQLIILAARPGMGKTSLALNIAKNIGVESDEEVALFSLEMSKNALAKRLLSSESKVPFKKIQSGQLSDRDYKRINNAMARLAEAPIFIDDTPSLDVLEMKAKVRRMRAEHGISMAIVDYLQLMDSVGRQESREQQLAGISRGLKKLAMELEIPVLALTQLNRRVEHRDDKQPKLADLRGSGAIEQDADLVCFVHRDYVFSQKEEDKGRAQLIVGKQRNGPTGPVPLTFRAEHMSFEESSRRDEPVEI
jgi:replicative DNA helicase